MYIVVTKEGVKCKVSAHFLLYVQCVVMRVFGACRATRALVVMHEKTIPNRPTKVRRVDLIDLTRVPRCCIAV